MDKVVLKAQNEEELNEKIKKIITLEEDEIIKIKVLKEPKKILFIKLEGTYEVQILKKSELNIVKNNETNFEKKKNLNKNVEKKEIENKNKNNFVKKEKNIRNKEQKKEKLENKNKKNIENKQPRKINETNYDKNYDKIRGILKEFIVKSKLDINIVNIEKKDERYLVNVDGKDIRYLIGEKGSTLNSIEYLLSSIKSLKNIKVTIDSNNYKKKREESLRELARKKGKVVLETEKNIKLNPMSARERKIIHEEISLMKGLKTESVGEEPKRYLVIKKV